MSKDNKAIIIWLSLVIVTVFFIIFVGGVTRLTHSGLSMVDWKPIMGILPPLNEGEWLRTFERYKLFPEYKLINEGMSLSGFKSIFFWEYFHRILGRLVGVIFFIPWLYFTISKKITKRFAGKIFGIFVLGGLQGLMGWYMVKSGLADNPYVSHYRLAAHLSLALILICITLWVILDMRLESDAVCKENPEIIDSFKNKSILLFAVISLQIVYGAFVAGLKAGFSYNTFPKMDGEWFPSLFFDLRPAWINIFEGIAAVQFIHRTLGLVCVIFTLWFWATLRKRAASKALILKSHFLILAVVFQFLLGVFTLISGVQIALASIHQLFACFLLLLTLWVVHHLSRSKS